MTNDERRDMFAAAAMTGLLAGGVQFRGDEERDKFCAAAWKLADAMLAARGTAGSVTLTDAERRELEAAASGYENSAEKIVYGSHAYELRAATIRGLLARATKEGER